MNWYDFGDRENYLKWFHRLKPNDKFAMRGSHWNGRPFIILEVEKITPKGWVKTIDGSIFIDGRKRGGNYVYAQPLTQEVEERIHESELRGYFDYYFRQDAKKFTYKELIELDDLIAKFSLERDGRHES